MKIDRLIAIIMILLERKSIGAAELAEMFGVSLRTIYRDMDALGQAGIPIVTSPGPGGGVGIMESYKVEKRLFSTVDITTLLMGLGSVHSTLPSDAIVGTLAKVKGMIPREQHREMELKAGQIKIDLTPWHNGRTLPAIMEMVRVALEGQQVLRFHYGTRRNEKSIREVEPYRLLLRGMNWYLQGFCRTRQDFRTFKLLRMSDACILEEHFQLQDFSIEQLDQTEFSGETVELAKLRIHEKIWDQIVEQFGEDAIVPDGPEHYIAHIHIPVGEFTCRYILGFGDLCECLEPESMRVLLRETLDRVKRFYGNRVRS